MVKIGIADLLLHIGTVPQWLANRMQKLAKAILEVMVIEFGEDEIVKRFSDPLWFQAFNNIIGMDWDSSGSTTVTLGILKSVTWRYTELGVLILGGKGSRALNVPKEIEKASEILGLSTQRIEELREVSRLGAKVDTALLQDGYTLYHHSLIISRRTWSIIQQGMNTSVKLARRYHLTNSLFKIEKDIEGTLHSGIACNHRSSVLNLIDTRSRNTRRILLDLIAENTNKLIKELKTVNRILKRNESLEKWLRGVDYKPVDLKNLKSIYYKPIKLSQRFLQTLNTITLQKANSIRELLNIRGVGAEVIRALTLVADLIYSEKPSFNDPVTHPLDPFIYSYAHGGKDGVPYSVRPDLLDQTIMTLEEAIEKAKIGNTEKLQMLRKLRKLFRDLGARF